MSECTLCSLPTPDPPVTTVDVEGQFCCEGCLQVHQTLDEVDDVDETTIRSRLGDQEADRHDTAGSGDDAVDADGETAFLAVDGMHCTTCEAFLEARAAATDGVSAANASYATDLMRVSYDSDVIDESRLFDRLSTGGYQVGPAEDRSPGAEDGTALARFLIGGGLFGMMTMMYYVLFLYPTYFGYEPFVNLGGVDGLYLFWQIWLLTSLVLFYTGSPILRGAYVSLRARQPNMDLLVSIAAVAAYLYSTVAMVIGRTDLYFDVTVAIILVVTAGTYYERHVKRGATDLLSDLAAQQVDTAVSYPSGDSIAVDEIEPGDTLRVSPGDRIPVDGTVVDGVAAVDEALVTGESLPVTKRPGDEVSGGTVVTNATLIVEADAAESSTIDRLVETLWQIQSARPGVQRLADRLATVFVPLVVVVSAVTLLAMLLLGSTPTTAMLAALTVLIVACPCALGLATPLAVATGVRDAAKRGIVVTAAAVFESDPEVDVVAVDKTGTLTTGRMQVRSVETPGDDAWHDLSDESRVTPDGGVAESPEPAGETVAEGADAAELLETAAALEAYSTHPVADAITERADRIPEETAGVDTHARGVSGTVGDRSAVVGHPRLFDARGIDVPARLRERATEVSDAGDVPVLVGWDGQARGLLVVGDTERKAWDSVLDQIGAARSVVVLTGDDSAATQRFQEHPAVDEVFAGVPPDGKAATIERLKQQGRVAMIGDGSNDAPALAAADLGIAIGDGTQLAVDAGDVVVANGQLDAIPAVFDMIDGTRRRIRENLGWAFVYNGLAIPMAVTGVLNPLLAALAMATSSSLVVLNSTRAIVEDE